MSTMSNLERNFVCNNIDGFVDINMAQITISKMGKHERVYHNIELNKTNVVEEVSKVLSYFFDIDDLFEEITHPVFTSQFISRDEMIRVICADIKAILSDPNSYEEHRMNIDAFAQICASEE